MYIIRVYIIHKVISVVKWAGTWKQFKTWKGNSEFWHAKLRWGPKLKRTNYASVSCISRNFIFFRPFVPARFRQVPRARDEINNKMLKRREPRSNFTYKLIVVRLRPAKARPQKPEVYPLPLQRQIIKLPWPSKS